MLLAPCAVAIGAATAADHADVYFEKDIRPIFKAQCFQCHGQENVREADLDLRLRRWIEQGTRTVRSEPESIDQQVPYTEAERRFWAFQPIERSALPRLADSSAVQTPVDQFILARLQAEGLGLSERADRRTLIRRLYFDLLGLPPSPAAIDRFIADDSPAAVRRLIDSLLASPAYGERWGRHWLDVAGYADSEGYSEEDRVRESAFRYRDYVIRSFAADKPIDQFIREQLAGDEMLSPPYKDLSEEQIETLTATGFLRMAPDGTASGGVDQNLARNQTIADTLYIVSSALLGMTVAGAQCHDHRYDPITQVDDYRMRAIFEPAIDWKNWRNPDARGLSLYNDRELESKQQVEAAVAIIEAEQKKRTEFYIDLTLEEELDTVDAPLREPLRTAYKTADGERTEEQRELLQSHPRVQNISPGSLYLYDERRAADAAKIDMQRAEQARKLVDATRQQALAEAPAEVRQAVQAAATIEAAARSEAEQSLLSSYPAVLVTEATLAEFNPQAAAQLDADRDRAAALRAIRAADDLKTYGERIAAVRQRIPAEGFIRGLTEPPGHVPPTFVFHRGDHEQPRQQVEPAGFGVLGDACGAIPSDAEHLPTTGRRLAYAQQLTSRTHPLVARVFVNRVWAQHFGQGIVGSLGDFGMLGDRPTHPELLDWLSSEFMDSGWQLQRLHRLILLSATFQQTSRRTELLDRMDPDNRLYCRMSLRRLEAEAVRDSVLEVCGQLNRSMFGPPVPVMEDEVGQIVIVKEMLDGEGKPQMGSGLGGEEARRSLYVQARRSGIAVQRAGRTAGCVGLALRRLDQFQPILVRRLNDMNAPSDLARRRFLRSAALNLSALATAWLLQRDEASAQPSKPIVARTDVDLRRRPTHHPPRATSMISLFMQGGPSQVDLLDPKPLLNRLDGEPFPGTIKYDNAAQANSRILGSPWKFSKHGQGGIEISELLPRLGTIADEILVIRSMHTGVNNHGQSIHAINSGRTERGRPSLGSWMTYALGAETDELPAYIAMTDPQGLPVEGVLNWANGWLPSLFQGTVIRPREPRILNLEPPAQLRGDAQRKYLEFVAELNRQHLAQRPGEAELVARMANYELAARMQTAAQEALDIGQESAATQRMYSLEDPQAQEFGTRCLIARRLVERGVRFVQLFTRNQYWDHHGSIRTSLPASCRKVDQGAAALVADLKQRGLLDSTVVHWGGEMGRLPVIQNDTGSAKVGLDHNTYGFSMWLAGGGFRGGQTYGQTDEFGHHAMEDVVHHYDYHATLLHLFGLDAGRVTYHRGGREQSLLDGQSGKVIEGLIA
jgi:hypothetical protein